MARPKEFEKEEALEAAINVFREHGFAGTSAGMLTEAMKIGRQSLYDTFGDKWQLYCLAAQRYAAAEIWGHLEMLRGDPKAMDGIRRMIERVVAEARRPCLGVSSISEFGEAREDLAKIRDDAGRVLRTARPMTGEVAVVVVGTYGGRRRRPGAMSAMGVRRDKAALSSGCEPHPSVNFRG